eukprot:Pgem_evm1s17691
MSRLDLAREQFPTYFAHCGFGIDGVSPFDETLFLKHLDSLGENKMYQILLENVQILDIENTK